MKTLYIECNMGAAGDMLMAALLELVPGPDQFISRMNGLDIPGVAVSRESSVKCGITGTHVSVLVRGEEEESLDVHTHSHDHGHDHDHEHDHGPAQEPEHSHAGLTDITSIIRGLPVSEAVKENALAVYRLLAQAEADVHGRPVEQVHFHEVGTMDAIADIVGVCLLMEEIAPDRVIVSPIHVGSGQVRCSHGILPVPAPATAYILQGMPSYGGAIRGELCTPTGAAILKYFATEFGSMPLMRVKSIGYGMGKKDFEAANCVRAMLGTSGEQGSPDGPNDEIVELSCNLDDMTGEALGYAQQQLLELGALDVYMVPIQMKKSRPGQLLSCLCKPQDADRLACAMLHHTTSFGVRRQTFSRYTLSRHMEAADTALGPVRVKKGSGYGTEKMKYEYEDVAALAKRLSLPIHEVYALLQKETSSDNS
jgi:uncharacterized protein (TIGR00299 family) protein